VTHRDGPRTEAAKPADRHSEDGSRGRQQNHDGDHHASDHHAGDHHAGDHHAGDHHASDHHDGDHHDGDHHHDGDRSAPKRSGDGEFKRAGRP
jgi:hypothetical protein